MSELEDRLALVVRKAVADALDDVDLEPSLQRTAPESWRSRIWSVDAEARLALAEVAEALGVSERTVRRYTSGETDHPVLPSQRGPTGITVTAGNLRNWIQDVEGSNRFRVAAGGRR